MSSQTLVDRSFHWPLSVGENHEGQGQLQGTHATSIMLTKVSAVLRAYLFLWSQTEKNAILVKK